MSLRNCGCGMPGLKFFRSRHPHYARWFGPALPCGPQEALAADCEKWDIPPLSDAEIIQLRIRVIALENMVLGLLSKASADQLAAIEEIAEFISPRADAKPHPLTLHAATQMEHFVERARRLREQPTAD